MVFAVCYGTSSLIITKHGLRISRRAAAPLQYSLLSVEEPLSAHQAPQSLSNGGLRREVRAPRLLALVADHWGNSHSIGHSVVITIGDNMITDRHKLFRN